MRSILRYSIFIAFILGLQLLPSFAQQPATATENCNQAMPDPITHIKVTGDAWQPLTTRDGCWMFVSLGGGPKATAPNGLAVLHRNGAAFEQVRVVPNERPIFIALTHDEKTLIVSVYSDAGGRIELLDVGKLTSGQGNALIGSVRDQHFGSLQSGLVITSDDKYLLVAQKITSWISIIDLDKARSGQAASSIVGGIPLSGKPLGMELSPDRKYLYLSGRFDVSGTQSQCKVANTGPEVIQIFDLERALVNSDASMIAAVPAGCTTDTEPTDGNAGIAFSPDGNTVYALAGINGGENTLFTFDARPLRFGSSPMPVARLPMHSSLRRLGLVDEGKKLLVTTWNQMGNDDEGQVLTIINTAKLARGEDSIVGTMPIGTGGGSMSLTPDGRAVLIATRTSQTVTRVEWARVPLFAQQAKNTADTCNQPMPDAITHIKIENGDPWHAIASPYGCWIFVRTGGPLGGLVVLQRTGGIIQPFRSIKGEENNSPGSVNSLSHSGKTLIVSKDREIEFFDVQKLTSQREDPIAGRIGDQHFLGSNGVMTSDEKRLFATQHLTAWLSAIDLTESADHTLSRAAISGGIALDSNPATPVLSPDERYLYIPSFDSADSSWPMVCRDPAAGSAAATLREGSIQVVDVRNPKLPVVATLKAGCSTRRVVVSPDGNTIFATAAWDNV
jgi:DNA-binding beta-propeller fold protein YncE